MTAYVKRQHLEYSAAQLFDLVADVDRYPEFFPWVKDVRSHSLSDRRILVVMTVAAGPFDKRFSTTAVLDRPRRIDISSDDPMFDRFEQRWAFEPAAEGGTNVEYHVDFQFRSRVLEMLMGATFVGRAGATLAAFTQRARQLYGGQS